MSCPSCGLPGVDGTCGMCRGDPDLALSQGLIGPEYFEPEPRYSPEEELEMQCADGGHMPFTLPRPFGPSCHCGAVPYEWLAATYPA